MFCGGGSSVSVSSGRQDCYAGVSQGRGFDGLGDSVATDSDSDTESGSEGDSGEELVSGPPPPPLPMGGPRFGAPPPLAPGKCRWLALARCPGRAARQPTLHAFLLCQLASIVYTNSCGKDTFFRNIFDLN